MSDSPFAGVGHGSGTELGTTDTMRYQLLMAMTLRLSDEQTEALRRKAEAEHRSMQQVALAAIDAYVHQATPARRSANEFARGDRTGALITRVPLPAKASSNAVVNLLSRSRGRPGAFG